MIYSLSDAVFPLIAITLVIQGHLTLVTSRLFFPPNLDLIVELLEKAFLQASVFSLVVVTSTQESFYRTSPLICLH